jgi:hypothetical protein
MVSNGASNFFSSASFPSNSRTGLAVLVASIWRMSARAVVVVQQYDCTGCAQYDYYTGYAHTAVLYPRVVQSSCSTAVQPYGSGWLLAQYILGERGYIWTVDVV